MTRDERVAVAEMTADYERRKTAIREREGREPTTLEDLYAVYAAGGDWLRKQPPRRRWWQFR